jgi:hypothetical protein
MTRARHAFAVTVAGAFCVSGLTLLAQTEGQTQAQPKAPEFKQVLAGKKFTPPIRGAAEIDFIRMPTKREGSTLVTKFQVKNTSNAPIARLTIDETWYDKNQNVIPGGKGVANGLLQPGEIQTIEVKTPVNPNMASSMLQFSHANGTVPKPHGVKAFDKPAKEPATKTAAATKAPAKKK